MSLVAPAAARALLRAAIAAFGLSTVAVVGAAADVDPARIAHEPMPCSVSSCEAAISAAAFIDSIGADVSIEHRRHFDRTVELLADLKVRHVRVGMFRDEAQRDFLRHIAAHGINATLITSFASTAADIQTQLAALGTSNAGGFVETVEGINEPNNPGMPWYIRDWPEHTRRQQKIIWDAVRGNPSTASVAVLGPSVCCNFADQRRLGSLAGLVDFGNMHDYFGSENPGTLYYTGHSVIDENIGAQRAVSGDKPIISTETGWGSRITDRAGGGGVDAVTQAKYILRGFFEHQLHGVARTFDFAFLDDANPSQPFGSFGIVGIADDDDLRPKPAFFALKQLLEVLSDTPSHAATTGLSFTLGGETQGVEHLLLQKQDGSFYLAVWIETMSWNKPARRARDVPRQRVKLRVTTPIAEAELVSMPASETEMRRVPLQLDAGSVDLGVGDTVQLVHLIPLDQPTTEALPAETPAWRMIRNVNSGLCFFVVNASLNAGARIAQTACASLANQHFILARERSASQSIKDAYSGNCLTEAGSQGGKVVTTATGCSPGAPSQSFKLVTGENGQSIVGRATGLCVTVPGSSVEEGAQLEMKACNGESAQLWNLTATSPQ